MAKIAIILRILKAGVVFAREGVITSFDRSLFSGWASGIWYLASLIQRRDSQYDKRSTRLANALTRLGPSYVKLGQFLSTRPDVVGTSVADELMVLQDKMAPFPDDEAKKIIEANLGAKLSDHFERFSAPVGAASIAQVHLAYLVGGENDEGKVAIKVLRPGVRRRLAIDLATFGFVARLAERFSPASRRLRPMMVVETLAKSVAMEIDFRMEAAAISEMAVNTADDQEFTIPVVDWQRTNRDILVSSWIDGIGLSDPRAVEAAGIDGQKLAATIIQTFLRHALRDGFFHADMHPGNLFVDRNGHLAAVDFGIMGRLGLKERHFLAEILFGFITCDYLRAAKVHFAAGYVPSQHKVEEFAQALRAIGEPIHGRPANEISMASLLGLLFEVTEIFDMQTRPELLLLQKTMVVVEGVARKFDPGLDMWKIADPVVRGWIEDNLGIQARVKEISQGALGLSRNLLSLPTIIDNIADSLNTASRWSKDGIKLDNQTIDRLIAKKNRCGRFIVLALVFVFGIIVGWFIF